MRAVTVHPLSYRSAFRKYTSPKKTFALVSLAITALSAIRVVVCVAESYSAVAQERQQDIELMQLCDSGHGGASSDFRALCLKKRAERAAPLLLKALLRAVTSAFIEFTEAFGSTSRILLLVLFCITGVSAPIAKALAAIFIQNLRRRRQRRKHESDSEDESDDEHDGHANGYQVIDVGNRHCHNTRQRLQLSLRRSLRSAAERMGVEPLELGLIKED
jgi:hypothetical protein